MAGSIDVKKLYREYKRYYKLGSFNHVKGLTGKPEIDLKNERVFKDLLKYLNGKSPEKEKVMKSLAKVLNVSEADVYDLYRTYRKNPSRIKSKLLRSFLSNLSHFHSRNPELRKRALKKSKELLKAIESSDKLDA